jgi:hypothetical protein
VTLSGGVKFSVPQEAWKVHKQAHGWEERAGLNNVFGQAQSKADTPTIKYLGDLKSTADCEAAAQADAAGKGPYLSYTFHTADFGGEFAGQCFGRTSDIWDPTPEAKVDSGRLLRQNTRALVELRAHGASAGVFSRSHLLECMSRLDALISRLALLPGGWPTWATWRARRAWRR